MRRAFRARSVAWVLAFALSGVIVATAALWRLLSPISLPSAAVNDVSPSGSSPKVAPVKRPTDAFQAALRLDPFRAERRPPTTRFRFPGEPLVTPVVAAVTPVRLIGIVSLAGNQGFILAQSGAEPARVVHLGGSIGGLTLRAVSPDHATLVGPDGKTVELHSPKPGT